MKGSMLLFVLAPATLGVALGASGCEEKKAGSEIHADSGAGTDKYATADPKLTKALQAAASASAAAENGPPPDGIFPPGVADQKHPRGAPTKVDVVSQGASPSLPVATEGDGGEGGLASSYGPAMLNVAVQLGQRTALPTIDMGLQVGPAKKEEGGPDWLVAEVKRSRPAKEQFGALPQGAEKDIAGLEGTRLRVKLTPDGRESEAQEELAKGALPDLDRLAQNAVEALVLDTVPLPGKPVGVGAQWIAETRMSLAGVDVIAYRAYRITGAEGDRLKLSLEAKAYSATRDVQVPGVPKGAALEQFNAEAQGELELARGEVLARRSDVQQRVVLLFAAPDGAQAPQKPGGPGGNMVVQVQSRAKFVRGEDLRAAAKRSLSE